MTSPPDKLFRQGLEHYQKSAPGSAWERIESGLDRKKHKSPWFKIAATLLLLMVASFVIWQLNVTDTAVATISKESSSGNLTTDTISSVATDESKDKIRESSDVSRESIVKDESSDMRRQTSDVRREALKGNKTLVDNYKPEYDNSKKPKTSRLQSPVYSLQSSASTEKAVTPDESQLAATIEPAVISIESTPVSREEITHEISTDGETDSKRTSITYTADEVNAKYLKKESASEATLEKKNTSGLQKVIDLALELKNEGSVLGDIREMKNEWLSINIPSNKREINK